MEAEEFRERLKPRAGLRGLACGGLTGFVRDGVELAVVEVHSPQLFEVEGARAAATEDGDLVAALVNGSVASVAFGDLRRGAFRRAVGDDARRGPRAVTHVAGHGVRVRQLDDLHAVLAIGDVADETRIGHADLDVAGVAELAAIVE